MADTVRGWWPDAQCEDCGCLGVNFAHNGPVVPDGRWHSFCGVCWTVRHRQYEATGQPPPIGANIRNRPKQPPDAERPCDKCGRTVAPEEDSGALSAIRLSEPQEGHRHLFPVIEGGVQVCEGSPSVCQYLPDQPRDARGAFDYDPEYEQPVRRAYQQLLESLRPQAS